MLVSDVLPNLVNGVSQQAPTQRLESQGVEQVNGHSSIVEGLKKRAPTAHLAKILNGDAGDAFAHLINRDETEQYVVTVVNGVLKVFDLAGNEKAVSGDMSYLSTPTPSTDLRALTVADYTFIVNRRQTVRIQHRGAIFTVRFPTFSVGATCFIKIDDSVNHSFVVSSGDNSTSIATDFTTGVWWDPAVHSVTRDGDTLTIQGIGTKLNQELEIEATVTNATTTFEAAITSTPAKDLQALVYVKQGNYSLNYTVNIFESSSTPVFTFTTTTSPTDPVTIRTDSIATALRTGLNALGGFTSAYTVTVFGSLMKIVRADGALTPFSVTCQDSNGDRNMVAIQGMVQKFVDLPTKCFDGLVVKIQGDSASEADDYYVQFSINNNGSGADLGVGTWAEYRRSGISHGFNLSTMPHTLIRQGDGTFVFGEGAWDERLAGDESSNPPPSFVNRTIEDMFFHRNRLGLLANQNWIQSEAGEYFNFWRTTVQAILDGDPIDVSAATTKVTKLRHAVPFAEKLVLFADQQQFVAGGGDLLTAKTASIKPTTSYEITGLARPVGAGSSVYFPTPLGDFTGIREYTVNENTSKDEAGDITAHIPSYIPKNVFKLASAPNENLLVLLTKDDPSAIYVYKYYFLGTDKLQASWSHWRINTTAEILDADFINMRLYLVVQREDGVYIEVLSVEADRKDTGMEYEVLLDRRVTEAQVVPTYNSTTNTSTWVFPYATSETMQLVVRNGAVAPFKVGQLVKLTRSGGSPSATFTATGNFVGVPYIAGVQYAFEYTMGEIVPKQKSQSGSKPMTGARLQLRTVTLVYSDTGYFRVEVTPQFRDTYTYVFTPKTLGQYPVGTMNLESGEFSFPVASKSDQVEIKIINDSHLPCKFTSASWDGELILTARRM